MLRNLTTSFDKDIWKKGVLINEQRLHTSGKGKILKVLKIVFMSFALRRVRENYVNILGLSFYIYKK